MTIHAQPLDPRLVASAADALAYAVIFWADSPSRGDGTAVGPAAEEWLLQGADIEEVLTWAQTRADGRTIEILALSADPMGYSAVRILGLDPSEAS